MYGHTYRLALPVVGSDPLHYDHPASAVLEDEVSETFGEKIPVGSLRKRHARSGRVVDRANDQL